MQTIMRKVSVETKETAKAEGGKHLFHFTDEQVKNAEKITLVQGLHGLQCTNHFAFLDPQESSLRPFKVLYNLVDPSISFIVLAAEAFNGFGLSPQDKALAADTYGIALNQTKVLYLVRIHKRGDSYEMTANLRAPIIIDWATKQAWQHILDQVSFEFDFPLKDIFSVLHKHKDD